MKKLLSSAIVLSLAFLFNSAFAMDLYYPTATPRLLNKGNMNANPANPYIGQEKLASFSYGVLSLRESSNFDSLKGNSLSLSGDVPIDEAFSLFGERSVFSIGHYSSKIKVDEKKRGEYDVKHSTLAFQISSQFGENLQGSIRLRMENADKGGSSASYNEFDFGFNYTLENNCEIGAHISPQTDEQHSESIVQGGIGCRIGASLAVGADIAQLTKGEKDSENGLILSADYLYTPDIDVEVILNFYQNERNLELSLHYVLDPLLLRGSFVALNEKDKRDDTYTAYGLLLGVAGYF